MIVNGFNFQLFAPYFHSKNATITGEIKVGIKKILNPKKPICVTLKAEILCNQSNA